MDLVSIILWIVIGAVAGWIAGELMRGHGFGLIGNIVVGIVGAFLGGLIFSAIGIGPGLGLIGSLITAIVGAVVLLFIVGLLRRSTV
ncbi:MAG: GlsB/YeaQ/YmgE family stress response membrane protein [Anaerolineae bacterium]|nr:GlsB/YeaQ/YmgE family stress response membrane protein [Anaerolineae bacterium]